MEVSRERHQHGSVPKLPRSQGFAWEFRFYLTAPNGKRKLKVQTFDSLKYPTERDVRTVELLGRARFQERPFNASQIPLARCLQQPVPVIDS